MATYTVLVRDLMEMDWDFGLDSYPIYDEAHRPILNEKILNHYKWREIGTETPGMFTDFLRTKMKEIMPKYNILYENEQQILKSLLNGVNLTEEYELTGTRDNTGSTVDTTSTSSEGQTTSLNKSKNVRSDTPQGSISTQEIDDTHIYASEVDLSSNDNTSSSESTSSVTSTNTVDLLEQTATNYIRKNYGNNRDMIAWLKDYRLNIVDIDMMIIEELKYLFMGIY